MPTTATATAKHILVKDARTCERLKTRLTGTDCEDFDTLAHSYSECSSGLNGGTLGTFGRGQMVPEFDRVVFDDDVKLGEVQGCVQTQFGYHLIQVTGRSPGA
jgi:peptidyl-prolyl cis-trans isomerase C